MDRVSSPTPQTICSDKRIFITANYCCFSFLFLSVIMFTAWVALFSQEYTLHILPYMCPHVSFQKIIKLNVYYFTKVSALTLFARCKCRENSSHLFISKQLFLSESSPMIFFNSTCYLYQR